MENHLSYLKIPLPLIRELLVTPRSAADIIRFSIYWMSSESLAAREEYNAVRQALYEFCLRYRCRAKYDDGKADIEWEFDEKKCSQPGTLPISIIEEIKDCISSNKVFDSGNEELWVNVDGEDDREVELNDYAIEQLIENMDCAVFEDVCTWYKIRQFNQNVRRGGDDGKHDLFDVAGCRTSYFKYSNVNTEVWGYVPFDIMERYANKARSGFVPEYERVQLACFIAMKSIIGMKNYAVAPKEQILARMIGCRNKNDFEGEMKTKNKKVESRKIVEKYRNVRQFPKLMNSMVRFGYLQCCFSKQGAGGGWCFSTKLDEDTVMNDLLYYEQEKILANNHVQDSSRAFAKRMKQLKLNLAQNQHKIP